MRRLTIAESSCLHGNGLLSSRGLGCYWDRGVDTAKAHTAIGGHSTWQRSVGKRVVTMKGTDKAMNSSRRLLAVTATAVLSLILCGPLSGEEPTVLAESENSGTASGKPSAPATEDGGWHLSLSPYIWFAGAHGTVGALGHDLSFHASPSDLLSHFDFGIMGAAEARRKRFLLNGDMIWIRLSDSRAVPFPGLGAVSANATVGEFVWTSKLGYRLIDSKKFKADANVGVRYWHLGQKLNFNPSGLGINFNGSQSWADILVGGRVQFPAGKKAVIDLLGDVGGWDATAKLDYQFATLLGIKLCPKATLQMGYRYLFVDYRNGHRGVYNVVTSGAVLGVTFNLK